VARRYALGYDQILKTNPSLNRWIPGETQKVLIADRYILPDAPRRGIVLNVAELRLYYYLIQHPDGGQPVFTFPVSLGRMDWRTPLGATTIIRKERNPAWRPPRSIREEHAAEGDYLPEVIPGGHPENPLGGHALYLGLPSYLIHGVDARKAYGIGMRVTHGCVRMYPEHIELLYRVVPIGTRVVLVDQPVKIGWEEDKLYLEVHAPFEEDGDTQPRVSVQDVMEMISQRVGGAASVDPSFVRRVVERGDGIPAVIATRHDRRYLR
jgi:L,D-transpeptidase ErfK/SrfK